MGKADILEAGENRPDSGLLFVPCPWTQALLGNCSGQRTFMSDSLSADVGAPLIDPNGSLNQPGTRVLSEA